MPVAEVEPELGAGRATSLADEGDAPDVVLRDALMPGRAGPVTCRLTADLRSASLPVGVGTALRGTVRRARRPARGRHPGAHSVPAAARSPSTVARAATSPAAIARRTLPNSRAPIPATSGAMSTVGTTGGAARSPGAARPALWASAVSRP